MFLAALLRVGQTGKEREFPSPEDWIKKRAHSVEPHLGTDGNQLLGDKPQMHRAPSRHRGCTLRLK